MSENVEKGILRCSLARKVLYILHYQYIYALLDIYEFVNLVIPYCSSLLAVNPPFCH